MLSGHVYGISFILMIHGVWCMVYGSWCMVHGSWFVAVHQVRVCVVRPAVGGGVGDVCSVAGCRQHWLQPRQRVARPARCWLVMLKAFIIQGKPENPVSPTFSQYHSILMVRGVWLMMYGL